MSTLIVAEVEFDAEGFSPGDYVLATKYDDGDPGDHYCTGFYVGSFRDRHLVADSNGGLYRYNGFRRIEKIEPDEGNWMWSSTSRTSSFSSTARTSSEQGSRLERLGLADALPLTGSTMSTSTDPIDAQLDRIMEMSVEELATSRRTDGGTIARGRTEDEGARA